MNTLDFILYLISAICFFLAVAVWRDVSGQPVRPVWVGWPTLVALGLLFWVLVPLIDAAQHM